MQFLHARAGSAPRRRLRLPAVVLSTVLAGLLLAAPALADSVLRLRPYADLKNIDPIWTTAEITQNHANMIYDVLFGLDHNLEPQPQMVDTYEVSSDNLTYTFTLRSGLRFHDGAPVTAADAVASMKRWSQRDGLGGKLREFAAGWEVVNDRTFRLRLKEPFGLVLQALGKINSNVPFVMPERMAETDPFKQIEENVGSGPFKFVAEEWVPGNKVVYVKNEAYKPRSEPADWASGGKVAKVDRVEWIVIPDFATAAAALRNGEVDMFPRLPVDLVPQLEADPNVTVYVSDPLGAQEWLRMNTLFPPFNDRKARQALQWMVSQEDYMRAIIGIDKFWRTCPAFFVCDTPLETDVGAERIVQQDLETAMQWLEEAGYDGEPIILMDPTDHPQHHPAALVTAQLLRQMGVNVEVQAMDWSTLTSRRAQKKPPQEGGWHLFHTRWPATGVLNPAVNIGVSGACDKAWFGWPCDERLEELRDAWIREPDTARQKQIAADLQAYAHDWVPYIPVGQFFEPSAYRNELKGVIQAPSLFLWNISKEE